jgi:protein-tyrosine phosphatase
MIRVLFVCHANLCRSPIAEAVMRRLVTDAGLSDSIAVDSAGTHVQREGAPPFSRTAQTLADHGITADGGARQLQHADLNTHDYVLAMDRRNLSFILRHSAGCSARVRMLLHEAQLVGLVTREDVRDPYPDGDYEEAYETIHVGCSALLKQLRASHGL